MTRMRQSSREAISSVALILPSVDRLAPVPHTERQERPEGNSPFIYLLKRREPYTPTPEKWQFKVPPVKKALGE